MTTCIARIGHTDSDDLEFNTDPFEAKSQEEAYTKAKALADAQHLDLISIQAVTPKGKVTIFYYTCGDLEGVWS